MTEIDNHAAALEATARRFYELLGEKNIERWSTLWHPEGRILVPYPLEGFPNLIDGRTAIIEAFVGLMANFESFESHITGVYPSPTTDSVTVEYSNDAVLRGGTRYTNDNIAVFRFREGLISEYHDFFDPRRFQVVVDALSVAEAQDQRVR